MNKVANQIRLPSAVVKIELQATAGVLLRVSQVAPPSSDLKNGEKTPHAYKIRPSLDPVMAKAAAATPLFTATHLAPATLK
jgi:hypothetical protein